MKSLHPDQISDEKLIKLVSEGDIGAFDQIYNRYWKRLFNVSYGLLQHEVVCQDIVQDIFVSLWTNRNKTISNLENYLFRSIKLKAFQQLRNGKVAQKHMDRIQMVSFANETEDRLNFRELEKHLGNGMAMLPPKCREVFYLSRFEGKSNKEIASRLSISAKTVEGHITYALKYFQKYFKEYISGLLALFISF